MFLNTVMTLTCLNAFKNTPSHKDRLKICANIKAMLPGHNFNILVDMPSKSQPCLDFSSVMTFLLPLELQD